MDNQLTLGVEQGPWKSVYQSSELWGEASPRTGEESQGPAELYDCRQSCLDRDLSEEVRLAQEVPVSLPDERIRAWSDWQLHAELFRLRHSVCEDHSRARIQGERQSIVGSWQCLGTVQGEVQRSVDDQYSAIGRRVCHARDGCLHEASDLANDTEWSEIHNLGVSSKVIQSLHLHQILK